MIMSNPQLLGGVNVKRKIHTPLSETMSTDEIGQFQAVYGSRFGSNDQSNYNMKKIEECV